MNHLCKSCKKLLSKSSKQKYCNNLCQADHSYSLYIDKWKRGVVSGARGKRTLIYQHTLLGISKVNTMTNAHVVFGVR